MKNRTQGFVGEIFLVLAIALFLFGVFMLLFSIATRDANCTEYSTDTAIITVFKDTPVSYADEKYTFTLPDSTISIPIKGTKIDTEHWCSSDDK